jgi:predicted RNase H-like nuclease (RuvC/YqgF family)
MTAARLGRRQSQNEEIRELKKENEGLKKEIERLRRELEAFNSRSSRDTRGSRE